MKTAEYLGKYHPEAGFDLTTPNKIKGFISQDQDYLKKYYATDESRVIRDGLTRAINRWDLGYRDYVFVYLMQRAKLLADANHLQSAAQVMAGANLISDIGMFPDYNPNAIVKGSKKAKQLTTEYSLDKAGYVNLIRSDNPNDPDDPYTCWVIGLGIMSAANQQFYKQAPLQTRFSNEDKENIESMSQQFKDSQQLLIRPKKRDFEGYLWALRQSDTPVTIENAIFFLGYHALAKEEELAVTTQRRNRISVFDMYIYQETVEYIMDRAKDGYFLPLLEALLQHASEAEPDESGYRDLILAFIWTIVEDKPLLPLNADPSELIALQKAPQEAPISSKGLNPLNPNFVAAVRAGISYNLHLHGNHPISDGQFRKAEKNFDRAISDLLLNAPVIPYSQDFIQ